MATTTRPAYIPRVTTARPSIYRPSWGWDSGSRTNDIFSGNQNPHKEQPSRFGSDYDSFGVFGRDHENDARLDYNSLLLQLLFGQDIPSSRNSRQQSFLDDVDITDITGMDLGHDHDHHGHHYDDHYDHDHDYIYLEWY